MARRATVSTSPTRRRLPSWRRRVAAIADGRAPELVWLIEHPPLYTAGTSAQAEDLIEARFPVHDTGRGGQFTYHGPGQRVAYVMLDLKRRAAGRAALRGDAGGMDDPDAGRLQRARRAARGPHRRVGGAARTRRSGCEDKIAAIGIRLKRWVSAARHRASTSSRTSPHFARHRAVRRRRRPLRRHQSWSISAIS